MNNVPTLRVAIIGCGCLGTRYASLLGEARLVVACDQDPRRAAALASGAHACFATNQIPEALSFIPDVVVVATPVPGDALIALACIRAGTHVFLSRQERASAEMRPVFALAEQSRKLVCVETSAGDSALPPFLQSLFAARTPA